MRIDKIIKLIKKSNVTIKELQEINQKHCLFGLIAEVGEVAGTHQKMWRGDYGKDKCLKKLNFELGDVMYYLFAYIISIGLDPEEVFNTLEGKINKRFEEGKIKGKGDHR